MSDHPLNLQSRLADLPAMHRVWHSHSEQALPFLSIASSRLELVVARHDGQLYVAVRGPETVPTVADCPPEGEWVGILFAHGVFFPQLPTAMLVNDGVVLPTASSRTFELGGSAWQFPTAENAETFVARLFKAGILAVDPVVTAVMRGEPVPLLARSLQRRFRQVTGLTHGAISQIERVHQAVALLQEGHSILDTVALAGYADQPHLTRALKRFVGQTPGQLVNDGQALPLSFDFSG